MLTQQSFNGALPGLTLKAWAQIAANGTLIKSSGLTSVTKGTTGVYTLNFSSNMATTTYLLRVMPYGKDGSQAAPNSPPSIMQNGANAVGSGAYTIYHNGSGADLQHFVEVYE